MTLLSAVTNVANLAGYSVASSVIGSTDVTTKQLAVMAQKVLKDMGRAYAWPKLYDQYSFATVDGTAMYALPGRFSRYHYDTFWNTSTRWRIIGPMSPQEYAEYAGYGLNVSIYSRFQIRGNTDTEILLVPTPTAAETVIFEFINNRYARPKTWTASTAFAAGTYCFYNGNYYSTTAGGTTGSTAPTHTSGSASDGGVTWAYYSGSYEEFLADTDEPVLNQDILERGMIEAFAEVHKLDFGPLYKDQLNEEFSRTVPGRVLSAAGGDAAVLVAREGRVVFGGRP